MKKLKIMLVAVVLLSAVNNVSASVDTFGTGENQFTIDFVNISGDTNPASGYGIVNYDYRMGTYEITNDQFAKFAANNPFYAGGAVPANRVSWFESAQFVNYLNTSTGHQAAYKFTGSTFAVWESGDAGYDASNPFRNSNAHYFMPTENEWIKAAYWNGTSLQTYASVGDATPTQSGWNFYDDGYATNPVGLWVVGSGSQELNGTFDMMGNAWEWMESSYYSEDYLSGSERSVRGGSWYDNDYDLSSSHQSVLLLPYFEVGNLGFRVASVPEPCTLLLLSLGGLALRLKRKV